MLDNFTARTRRHVQNVVVTLRDVFAKPQYWGVAVFSSTALLLVAILLPNHELIKYTVFTEVFSVEQKARILFTSLGAFKTNFTTATRVTTLLVAALVGINMAFVVYYAKKRLATQKAAGTSAVGMLVGLLGVGCSACGSVLISSVIGISAAGAIISFLPLKGIEFSILSMIIILGTIIFISNKVQSGNVCKIRVKKGG